MPSVLPPWENWPQGFYYPFHDGTDDSPVTFTVEVRSRRIKLDERDWR